MRPERILTELNEMEKLYETMDSAAFLRESRRRSNVIGREITVIEGERKYPARAVDIDSHGHLIIETAEGRTRLNYGEVSLKLAGKRENEQ